jgi:hypothetical protein
MSTVAIAAAAIALAVAVAGCGSSSPSMSRFNLEATRICRRAVTQSDQIRAPALPSGTAAFLRRGAAVLAPELAELRALRPPANESGSSSAALTAAAHQLSILDGTIHKLNRGADPLSMIKTLQRRLAPAESAESAAWRTLGVPACVIR